MSPHDERTSRLLDVPGDLRIESVEGMSSLETAVGFVFGTESPEPIRGSVDGTASELVETLAALLVPALLRQPCIIEFSGGRDSSVLLAVALMVARREGLEEPVAATKRHPGVSESREDEWQEGLVRHLGVTEWVKLDFEDELDLVGPLAQQFLSRYGVVWPPMLWSMWPFLQLAKGGALVSGEGGDEMFGPRRSTPVARLLYEREMSKSVIKRSALAIAPRPFRQAVLSRHKEQPRVPWLRPRGLATVTDLIRKERLAEPFDWPASLFWQRSLRREAIFLRNAARLAAAADVLRVAPFLEGTFLRALGRTGGRLGYASRTAVLRANFSGLLPDDVLCRSTKAVFNRSWFARHTRDFVARWDGSGVETDLVDPEVLRSEWSRERPNALSDALLQSAWLAQTAPPVRP